MTRAALTLALVLAPAAVLSQTYLVVVSGLGGEARYRTAFHETATTLVTAAEGRLGVPRDHIVYLAERPDRDPARIAARSTKDNTIRVLNEVAARAEPGASIVIVLIGHGSASADAARINLPGPDLTARELATVLDTAFPTQQVVVANTASASGGWIAPLSGERRVVITATRSGVERNESHFGHYFAEAFAADGADTDKNGRVSVFEAFEYARREVIRFYDSEHRMLTEHALLDDNGDREGSHEPGGDGADGQTAARVFLDRAVRVAATDDSLLDALRQRRDSLQAALAALRAGRATMEPAAYDRDLEDVLLEIARVGRAIRAREQGARQ